MNGANVAQFGDLTQVWAIWNSLLAAAAAFAALLSTYLTPGLTPELHAIAPIAAKAPAEISNLRTE